MKWIRTLWLAVLGILLLVSIPQCLYTGGESAFNLTGNQSALDPKGPVARNQADIFYLTLIVTTFLFVTVGGALGWATWRFRMRKEDDPKAVPPQSHGNPLVEVALVVASSALLVVIAVPTFGGIVLKKEIPEHYIEDAIEVTVTGYQWWWSFEYPEFGLYTANEIVFPVGTAVKLNLVANDVIHSFWLPKLAGKTDLIPGQTNTMWIKSEEPGVFWGQCAEYCGNSHAYMLFRARALPENEWLAWLERQQQPTVESDGSYLPVRLADLNAEEQTVVRHGAELFKENCVRCHSVDSRLQTNGPNLAHFGSRLAIAAGWLENNPDNLARWIREPHNIKPGNFMWKGFPDPNNPREVMMEGLDEANLSESAIQSLVAYMYQLQ